MPMGMENPLLLMGGDFEFYCLQLKKTVGIPKIFPSVLPSGDEGSVYSSDGDGISGYFLTGD